MKTLHIDDSIDLGWTIDAAIAEAIALASEDDAEVRFGFNGCELHVRKDSDPKLLRRDFFRSMEGYFDGPVGPYPAEPLSLDQQKRDAEIKAENERRHEAQCERWRREEEEKRARLEQEVAGVEFAVRDQGRWDHLVEVNDDPYGGGVMTYARDWALLMQVRMAAGNELEAIAKQASFDANIDGITGFMSGAAVSTLAEVWEHGERLRRWHNLDTQIRDEGKRANEEGGTLNPALLRMG